MKRCTRWNAAEQSVQWIGGILCDLQAFFLASGLYCSQTLSKPTRQPLTQTVETVEKVGKFNN